MAVGFGYVRDEEPAIVDWASITREARASIKQIEADRQKKREGVEEAMREQSKLLLNKPTSQNSQYNKAMANLVAQLESTSLENYKALRRGDIKLSDFNSVKNTLFSETQGILAIAKTYADNFDANILAAQNGTNSGFANWTNSITQEYMDFQGVSTLVDPTGKISFVKTLPDGTTQQVDTSELFSLATNNQAAYNYSGNITKALEDTGMKVYESDLGGITKGYFIDPLTGKADQDVLNKTAAGLVQQDYAVYSILHDFKGGYDFEKLPNSFYTENNTRESQFKALDELQKNNPNKIYVGVNGQPIITETLRSEALEYVKKDLEQYKITSKQADPYRKQDIVDVDIERAEEATEASKANRELINLKIAELGFDVKKQNTIATELNNYFSELIGAPIAAAITGAEQTAMVDREGELSRQLQGVLSAFNINISPAKALKQTIQIDIPGEDGTIPVTINLRGKTITQIQNEIVAAMSQLPAKTLSNIYDFNIQKTDEFGLPE